MKRRVVVVDDEQWTAKRAAEALREGGYDCEVCTSGRQALAVLELRPADALVTDLRMPEMDGIELLRQIRHRLPDLPVILLTAYGSVSSAVAAMREGAFDYVAKPLDADELRTVMGRALEMARLTRENHHLRQEVAGRYSPDSIVADSASTRELMALVRRVAASRVPVLVQGESGTGKELVARMIHYWSDRVGQPFVAVNCKSFAPGLLESELFGHERGAFTGALADHAGCFERANRGTLFLDEIGDIEAGFQAKLLRVLQEDEVLRVGGTKAKPIDVRVVAATNKNLRDELAAGRFREDLYFRLNVIPIQIAPLRERRDDILPLAQRLLDRHAAENGRRYTLSPETVRALLEHPWPGNVRELENAIERAVVLANGDTMRVEDLLLEQKSDLAPSAAPGSLQYYLDRAAALRISSALEAARGQKAEAARTLGIDRTTLYRLSRRLGIKDN